MMSFLYIVVIPNTLSMAYSYSHSSQPVSRASANNISNKGTSLNPPVQNFGDVVQRLTLIQDNSDSEILFEKRYQDNPKTHLSGFHNYAIDKFDSDNWARSASNRHAELAVLLAYAGGNNITIVSELKPCQPCIADLTKYETNHGKQITVEHFTPYVDKDSASNKAAIQAFYKGKGYIDYTSQIVPHLTDEGKDILGIAPPSPVSSDNDSGSE